MTSDLKSILNNHLPIDNSDNRVVKQPPIDAVDRIADELVAVYDNPKYRSWYCGVIYEFGIPKILEWQQRAREGKQPAKLFSKYVKDARTFRGSRSIQND